MKLFSRIFGTDTTMAQLIRELTDSTLTGDEQSSYYLRVRKAYEPFKLAQRFLAFVVVLPYVLIYLLCGGLMVASGMADVTPVIVGEHIYNSQALQLSQTAQALASMNQETLGMSAIMILGFYFAGGVAEGIIERIKKPHKPVVLNDPQ